MDLCSPDISWLASIKDYFFAFVGALMGLVLGTIWASRQWKETEKRQKRQLQRRLVKAFKANVGGIDKCLEFLTAKPLIVPNFRLDTDTLNHLLHSGRDLFESEEIFDAFNWQRYQLSHINAKMDYFHTYLSSPSPNLQLLQQELGSLKGHLQITKKEIGELLEKHKEFA